MLEMSGRFEIPWIAVSSGRHNIAPLSSGQLVVFCRVLKGYRGYFLSASLSDFMTPLLIADNLLVHAVR